MILDCLFTFYLSNLDAVFQPTWRNEMFFFVSGTRFRVAIQYKALSLLHLSGFKKEIFSKVGDSIIITKGLILPKLPQHTAISFPFSKHF